MDLEAQVVVLPDGSAVPFAIDAFVRHCLLRGIEELEALVDPLDEIRAWEGIARAGYPDRNPRERP